MYHDLQLMLRLWVSSIIYSYSLRNNNFYKTGTETAAETGSKPGSNPAASPVQAGAGTIRQAPM